MGSSFEKKATDLDSINENKTLYIHYQGRPEAYTAYTNALAKGTRKKKVKKKDDKKE